MLAITNGLPPQLGDAASAEQGHFIWPEKGPFGGTLRAEPVILDFAGVTEDIEIGNRTPFT